VHDIFDLSIKQRNVSKLLAKTEILNKKNDRGNNCKTRAALATGGRFRFVHSLT